ncbi:MAG TPA: GntR family transcriptional regulator [Candidatus Acidoferrales bacterium]|nr:GntR family transcriptional regulator [Candidatus Acidoferrales bacterium]
MPFKTKHQAHSRSRSGSIREKAYIHIQRRIANGTLAAGSGISELLLAKELKSSRAPIREAMHQLAAEGLLEQNPSGGMVVAQLKREDIIELYELREALEVYAVGKVARTGMQPPDKLRLQRLVDEVAELRYRLEKSNRSALDSKEMERFIACDLGFHALLMSMANNSRLQRIVSETRLLIRVFAIRRAGHDRIALKSIQRYHQKVLDSVVKQRPDAAMAMLAEHIHASQRERLDEYDQWKRESSLRESARVLFNSRGTVQRA